MDIMKLIKEYYPDSTVEYHNAELLKTIKIVSKKNGMTIYYIIDGDKLMVLNDGMGKKYNKDDKHYQKILSMLRDITLNELGIDE